MRVRTFAAALVVFLAGLVAACDSSSGSEDSGTTTTAVTPACESTLVTTACRTMEEYQP